MRRGDYGYDAPYFPAIFGLLTVAAGLGATICWRQGEIRTAMQMTLYFVIFLANTSSFLYATRRGMFLEPRYPQHPIECRSQTSDRRRLSCP
jgi:hypothetical protein